MNTKFSTKDGQDLLKIAVHKPTDEIVEVALKAAWATSISISEGIISALQKSDLPSWKMEHVLATVAAYEGLNFVSAALRNKYVMVRDAAVYALLTLNDEKSLAVLHQMLSDTPNLDFKYQVEQTARSIRESQRITECKQLGPLSEADYILAEALLDRRIIPASVPYLLKKLGHSNADARRHAVAGLLEMRLTIDEFYAVVERANIDVYAELVELLGRFDDPRRSTYVIKLLKSNLQLSDEVTDTAVHVLANIADDEAIIYLVRKMLTGSDFDFAKTWHAYIVIGVPLSPYALQAYASDETVRRTGGSRLVMLAGKEALPLLLESLSDPFRQVRNDAESALVELGSIAVNPLLALLNHDSSIVRRHACRALGRIGDGTAFHGLVQASQSENKHEHWDAVEALGGIQSAEAIEEISRWLRSANSETRRRAVKGLWNAKSEQAKSLLVQTSTDNDWRVRLQAVHSIAKQGLDVNLVKALVSASKDVNPEVAATAIKALVRVNAMVHAVAFGGEKIDALRQYLGRRFEEDPDLYQNVRKEYEFRFLNRPATRSNVDLPPPEIPGPINDKIHFSITAPRVVTTGDSFVLDVWAHFGSLKEEIFAEAKRAHGGREVNMRSIGPTLVERDTILRVLLFIPAFNIEHAGDEIYWAGETANCTFPVTVPQNVSEGFYLGTAKICVENFQVSTLSFQIEVGPMKAKPSDITTREDMVKTAFASYASQERNKVTGRIQGMLKIRPDLDIFLDVASLHSGEDWKKRLEQEIVSRDVLYLFWSRAASQSQWVDIEWRTALTRRGLEHIDPVPLEPGDVTPPPPELSSLHFNDWTLAFEK